LSRYRSIRAEPREDAMSATYSMVGYDDVDYAPFGTGSV
jgi:DNA-directed RNA polymerase subunit beta'